LLLIFNEEPFLKPKIFINTIINISGLKTIKINITYKTIKTEIKQ